MLRRLVIALALLAGLIAPVHALTPAQRAVILSPPGPTLNLGLLTGSLPSIVTFSRGSGAWEFGSTGLLVSVSSNVPRFDYGCNAPGVSGPLCGLLIEEARTNVALYSRDLTNAAWTKSNTTAAKDQTGIDGAANSASSLVATAGNGTCLQTITQAATASQLTAYVERITGTGEIDMTQDGGSTWTAITSQINSSTWVRVTGVQQTRLNPSIGFRIVTNGDKIAVDVNQLEAGGSATSPIITTSASVTRAADAATVPASKFALATGAPGVLAAEFIPIDIAGSHGIASLDDGSASNRINLEIQGTGTNVRLDIEAASSVSVTATKAGLVAGAVNKVALGWAANSYALAVNNTLATGTGTVIPTTLTEFTFGNDVGSGVPIDGWMRRVRYWNRPMSSAQVQALTQ